MFIGQFADRTSAEFSVPQGLINSSGFQPENKL